MIQLFDIGTPFLGVTSLCFDMESCDACMLKEESCSLHLKIQPKQICIMDIIW